MLFTNIAHARVTELPIQEESTLTRIEESVIDLSPQEPLREFIKEPSGEPVQEPSIETSTELSPGYQIEPEKEEILDFNIEEDSQTGALTYSFPIIIPPGRANMQPDISFGRRNHSHKPDRLNTWYI